MPFMFSKVKLEYNIKLDREVILKALEKHSINDQIIQSGLTILNRSIGIGKFRGEDRA